MTHRQPTAGGLWPEVVGRGRRATDRAAGARRSAVVIGYGSALRGDDAVGQRVAAAVGCWGLPGVHAIAVHQLTPELAEALADADTAIFVDADQSLEGGAIRAREVEAAGPPLASAHSCDPGALLALARAIYGRSPRAWWLTIAASRFDFGADLSPETWHGAAAALRWIRSHLNSGPAE